MVKEVKGGSSAYEAMRGTCQCQNPNTAKDAHLDKREPKWQTRPIVAHYFNVADMGIYESDSDVLNYSHYHHEANVYLNSTNCVSNYHN